MSWSQPENVTPVTKRVVHRQSISIVDARAELTIAGYRGVVHVANSRSVPGAEIDVWYEVDVNAADSGEAERVGFTINGTGHVFHYKGSHVGTVFTHDGALVWHVYATSFGVVRT